MSAARVGRTRLFLWLLSMIVLVWVLSPRGPEGAPIAYSEFMEQVDRGNVVTVHVEGTRIRGSLREPIQQVRATDTTQVAEFSTHVPAMGDDELLLALETNDVEVWTEAESDDSLLPLLLWALLPVVLLFALFMAAARGMAGRARSLLSIGQSGAREHQREDSDTTFGDVAGCAGAKRELSEIVSFLRDSSRFWRLGAEVPKGVLLVGPPGTGKTLLARAVAGEAGVPFYVITGSDFMEMFVGVGAKRVRHLFERAKENAPSIIFIDELDSVGRQRGAGLGGGHDEREQTLNQLLSELDGFEPSENVIVMAATNRPDILDPALLRPGRFDRRITVDLPSVGERAEILRLHARTMRLDPDVELDPVAGATPGFSGADLKNLLNEGALFAARRESDVIEAHDIEEARDRILLGLEREGLALTDEEIRMLACHEAGHALVAAVLPTADPLHKVTIVPRGRSMGSTHQRPRRERYLWTREGLLDRVTVALGGRAAEEVVLGTATSGTEDDLRRATALARKMVMRWGMSDEVGPFSTGSPEQEVFLGESLGYRQKHSEATAGKVDDEIRRLLEEGQARARDIVEEHLDALHEIADALTEREEIGGDEVERILRRHDGSLKAG